MLEEVVQIVKAREANLANQRNTIGENLPCDEPSNLKTPSTISIDTALLSIIALVSVCNLFKERIKTFWNNSVKTAGSKFIKNDEFKDYNCYAFDESEITLSKKLAKNLNAVTIIGGEEGVGKTTFAEVTIRESKKDCLLISGKELSCCKSVEGIINSVNKAIRKAKKINRNSPPVVLIDGFDQVLLKANADERQKIEEGLNKVNTNCGVSLNQSTPREAGGLLSIAP